MNKWKKKKWECRKIESKNEERDGGRHQEKEKKVNKDSGGGKDIKRNGKEKRDE